MGCKECGKPKCNGKCGCKSPKVLQINNPAEYITFHKVSIPAAMGDSTTNPPKIGAYRNALVYYEADHTSWMYSTDGIPTKLTNGLTDYNEAVNLPQINGHTLIGNQSSSDLGLQGELTAGANIQINGNVISATNTIYTAGNGIELDGTEIKAKIGDGLEFDGNGEINIADIEQYAHFFDNVADMKASENLIGGSYARTIGYYTKNDGGGATYKIRTKTIYDTIDDNKIVDINENLVAELIDPSELSTKLGVNLWTRHENINDVKARIDNYKFMGVTNLVVIAQMDGDQCTLTEDIDVINEAIAYAVSKKITVNTVKFHCTNSNLNTSAEYRALYQQHCDDVLEAIEGTTITRVITLNEKNSWFNNSATPEEVDIVRNMISHYKSLGYEVSISCAGLKYFLDCYYFHPEVTNSFDFIAINDYPVVGYNNQYTSEKEIKEAFSTFYSYASLIKSFYPNKDFILSEIGVQNVWQSLRSPANWRIGDMEGVTNSEGKIIPLYFSGLLSDPRLSNIFSETWLWYSEYYYEYPEETKIFRENFVGGNN